MSFLYKDGGLSAKDCITFVERPGTPEEIRRFRKSANLEPGKRFLHHGSAKDSESLNLISKNFGITSQADRITASDLINHAKLTDLEKINFVKSEKVYKGAAREPLGKCYSHNYNMPSKFAEGEAFGVKSVSSLEPAKEIIFPTMTEALISGEEIYKKTHGSYQPGEQKRRGYTGAYDSTKTFGAKGDTIALNGVSTNITYVLKSVDEKALAINTKNVEDFRDMSDSLGRSRNLGQGSGSRPYDYCYGKPSATVKRALAGKPPIGALEVIKGNYRPEDQMPDRDLGKSITPGFRNITLESRAYGCPSIRTDLPNPIPVNKRSVANSQNYGDDVSAADLVNPPAYSDLNIDASSMFMPRSKEYLVQLFQKIGFSVAPEVQNVLYLEAATMSPDGSVSIQDFRNVLNEYLDAVDTRRESEWRVARGL